MSASQTLIAIYARPASKEDIVQRFGGSHANFINTPKRGEEMTTSNADDDDAPRRTRARAESDDDEIEDEEANNGAGTGEDADGAAANKRRRLELQRYTTLLISHQMRLTPDSFPPGAIMRVSLKNFVTYTAAEFFPGPNMNLVIGPNGSGKSTIVCAICLGLGYKADVLGRAAQISEFVQHGKDVAEIEIELAEKENNSVVIKRRLNRDNKSQYWINGLTFLQNTSNKQENSRRTQRSRN
jgi:structural maintenance of chromosomes protein 5